MATITENINQSIADFNAIKNTIINLGIPIPVTIKTNEYASKIIDVYNKGKTEGGGSSSGIQIYEEW
ncbi:hypothetical protein [Massilibacteroides sp.]|uniref:hypothetical protein n=1 Tax=Massilibacteroides sp. TaxID=2034766 RepID=UPI00262ABC66|nr:hypothetical protein [Massilibacteroides sp.]MDD4516334.1 hypothetical protein [Massilibacteroides sp.]